MTLFKRGHAGGVMGCGLRGFFAALAEHGEGFLRRGDLLFEAEALLFENRDFRLAGDDDVFLFGALGGEALQFVL